MDINLSPDTIEQVQREIAEGRYPSADVMVEEALRVLLEQNKRGFERLNALERIGSAVDHAGLYDKILVSDQ